MSDFDIRIRFLLGMTHDSRQFLVCQKYFGGQKSFTVKNRVWKGNLEFKVEHKHKLILYDIYMLSDIKLSFINNPQTIYIKHILEKIERNCVRTWTNT